MSIPSYSPAFKAQAVRKALLRGDQTIAGMAEQLSVPYYTLKRWLREFRMADTNKRASAQGWSPEAQMQALQETYTLSEEALQAWCREKGLFVHQLEGWKAAFCAHAKPIEPSAQELRTLKDKVADLERDLDRKNKALAEAAALLVLQKKYQALWEDEDK